MYIIAKSHYSRYEPNIIDKFEELSDAVNMFARYVCDASNDPVDIDEEIAGTWDIINFGNHDYGSNIYGDVLVRVGDYLLIEEYEDDEEDED